MTDAGQDRAIAIIGVGLRVPGARRVADFWDLLVTGREQVRAFSPEELRAAGVSDEEQAHPAYVPFGAPLEDADLFDAGFFGMPPQEARVTDPQHRVFLECAHVALEDSGVCFRGMDGRVGVFGGTAMSSYLITNLLRNKDFSGQGISYPLLIGNDKDFLCTRVAYRLGLNGPAVTVQTACSTSLTAVHLACQSLIEHECDVALAGGVSITFPQTAGYRHAEGGPLSRDGRCRPFDAAANGTVKGNGCAVVTLKRLSDALADSDHIYAVIRGTAVNNDGTDKAGYTAPSILGQAEVIRDALAFSGLRPRDVGYVEAHGTGTYLGDPIEVNALAEAYASDPPGTCVLGSLKANLGHLDTAAGVVGLVKTALVLYHQHIPAQVNFTGANPELKLDRTPFAVAAGQHAGARVLTAAAVSAFGIGGTNTHCVLVPPVSTSRPAPPEADYPVMLSARDDEALTTAARELADHIDSSVPRVDDLCLTLLTGRVRRPRVLTFSARDLAGVLHGLRGYLDGQPPPPHPLTDSWLAGNVRNDAGLESLVRHARRTPLPTHPLRPERYWVDPDLPTSPAKDGGRVFAPRVDVDAQVLAIIRDQLGTDGIAPHDDFFDAGGESLAAIDIISAFRERFDVTMTAAEFADLRTSARMAGFIRSHGPRHVAEPVLTKVKDGIPGKELFYVHPAGGTTFCYYELARRSTEPSPVYGLSFPFSKTAELDTVPRTASYYLEQIRGVRPAGPYRLGGYSFGGNVAFEMAIQLQRMGEVVTELVMFDSLPPEAYAGEPLSEQDFLRSFPRILQVAFGDASATTGPPPSSVEEVVKMARQPQWTEYTAEEYEKFVRAWMVNHEALKTHRPRDVFRGDVTVFAAQETNDPALLQMLRIQDVPAQTWQSHVAGTVTVVPVPGNHYTIFDTGHVAELAARYDQSMSQSMSSPNHGRQGPGSQFPKGAGLL
jgi:3-oxoacyl-(acyl-carrier-protein) synthase/thioesterase domain-containing protein/acyl carrier protein